MPTQIAATPVIRGKEAKKIYQEANRKPSPKAEIGAKKLSMRFDKMMKQALQALTELFLQTKLAMADLGV